MGWWIVEPVLGATNDVETDSNDDDDKCHQMVLSWTIQDWRVNCFWCTLMLFC